MEENRKKRKVKPVGVFHCLDEAPWRRLDQVKVTIHTSRFNRMLVICGCGSGFRRSGFATHIRHSTNPKCHSLPSRSKKPRKKTVTVPEETNLKPTAPAGQTPGVAGKATSPTGEIPANNGPASSFEDPESNAMEIDPQGDFFGDYNTYGPGDFEGFDGDEGTASQNKADRQEEAEMDEYESSMADLEGGLEADHTSEPQIACSPSVPEPSTERTSPAMRLRGGAEEGLRSKPHIVHFPYGEAGKVYANDEPAGNQRYCEDLGKGENPYSPFTSKRDWLMAKWQKLRGPGSTAFDELMAIDGVRSKNPTQSYVTNMFL